MKASAIIFVVCLCVLYACSARVATNISKHYPPLDYKEDVQVLSLQEAIPANAEQLGVVKIGDTGFSTNCGWDVAIDKAKMEARKIGGNTIKITKHIPPSAFGSTCHRITATILRV